MAARRSRSPHRTRIQTHTDPRGANRDWLRGQGRHAWDAPWRGPVLMTVRAVFPIPPSWPAWKREAAADGLIWHTAKPDLDNIIKLVKDALPGIAYDDDAQVVGYPGEPIKLYGSDPGITVTLRLPPA